MDIPQNITAENVWPNITLHAEFCIGQKSQNRSFEKGSAFGLDIITEWEKDVLIGLVLDSSIENPSIALNSRSTHSVFDSIIRATNKKEFKIRFYGTPFQLNVWAHLLLIPFAEKTTYKDIARSLNCKAYQAVGSAIGRNPISILVPCHRVLGTNGALVGYHWGIEKKAFLLQQEQNILTQYGSKKL